MATLLELTSKLENISRILEAGIDVDGPEGEALLDKTIQEELDTRQAFDGKAEAYCDLLNEWDALVEARRAEKARLDALIKSSESRVKRLKSNLHFAMGRLGIRKYETTRYKIAIQKNGGILPMELDEFLVPAEYCKSVPDRERIREALEAGEQFAFARLGERGESVRIR